MPPVKSTTVNQGTSINIVCDDPKLGTINLLASIASTALSTTIAETTLNTSLATSLGTSFQAVTHVYSLTPFLFNVWVSNNGTAIPADWWSK